MEGELDEFTLSCSKQSRQVRHSLNSLPAPKHVMSRLFGNDDQWRYAQQVRSYYELSCWCCRLVFIQKQHPKDTPANAPLARQSQDFGDFSKIELDPASAARADLSGITMQEVRPCAFCI